MYDLLSKISGIEDNSQNVKEGYVFFAIRSAKANGEDYIEHAINKGAKFIVLDENSKVNVTNHIANVEFIKVKNQRAYLSKLVAAFYHEQPSNMVAITGTNGKTSVANFFQQIFDLLGNKSASIGTLGLITSESAYKTKKEPSLTSPRAVELHTILKELYNNSYTHVAIEASSHGIQQHRLDGVRLKAAGFTNFSQDHLDYHLTLEAYLKAKLRLFNEMLEKGSYAVLNADIEEFKSIQQICTKRSIKIIDYGKKAKNLQILSESYNNWQVKILGKKYTIASAIKGEFQLYNLLCAVGLAIACGATADKIMNVLNKVTAAKGRLELAGKYNGAEVYIDYAHTPDSLKVVLETLHKTCLGKLHVLFGCGGERDTNKRVLMGKVAEKYADHIIVTDDNPRGEDPSAIRKQIMHACSAAREVDDRAEAIKYAIGCLHQNDVLLIAGKGHEEYQLINGKKLPFSDFEVVKKIQSSAT
jgi:UDP-N-acetylmuramoyl-L-alanyl-D-glutamate--2,6-diaminopimelate ligase